MNALTIIFMEKAASHTSLADQIIQRLSDELLKEAGMRLAPFLKAETRFLSSEGRSFEQKMHQWMKAASALEQASSAKALFRDLEKMEEKGNRLHAETLQEINSPGAIASDRIHILFLEEQHQAQSRIQEAIELEMYRLVLAGEGPRVAELPKWKYVHPALGDLYLYYAQQVEPLLLRADPEKRFHAWAFQYKDTARIGTMARLPAYVRVAPKTLKTRMIPGECKLIMGTLKQWQGIGALTNVTPQTVGRIQTERFHTSIQVSQLSQLALIDEPEKLLNRVFQGELYAIQADDFFAALTMAGFAQTLRVRMGMGQCLYCGAEHASSTLCDSCFSKVSKGL